MSFAARECSAIVLTLSPRRYRNACERQTGVEQNDSLRLSFC